MVSPDEILTDPNGTFWDKKKFNITTQWDPTGHLLFHIDGYPKKQLQHDALKCQHIELTPFLYSKNSTATYLSGDEVNEYLKIKNDRH